jgi:hypothetical protein
MFRQKSFVSFSLSRLLEQYKIQYEQRVSEWLRKMDRVLKMIILTILETKYRRFVT